MVVERSCMRDQIRQAIVERILDGRLPAGTHLKEMTLAREFKVSQSPVREALRELEALGLLESERYCGTRVRSIELDELREAYQLRAAIEESALRLAIPCREEDLQKLEADIRRIGRDSQGDDANAYMDSALNFHRHIVQMSGNRLYLRAWEHMAWDVRARIAVQRIGLLGSYAEERQQVVDALRAGNSERAVQCLQVIFTELQRRLAGIREQSSHAASLTGT